MYAAIILLSLSIPLALGSWLALIPAALIAILFTIRTALEDQLLARNLEGY